MTEGSLSLLASFLKINYLLFTNVPIFHRLLQRTRWCRVWGLLSCTKRRGLLMDLYYKVVFTSIFSSFYASAIIYKSYKNLKRSSLGGVTNRMYYCFECLLFHILFCIQDETPLSICDDRKIIFYPENHQIPIHIFKNLLHRYFAHFHERRNKHRIQQYLRFIQELIFPKHFQSDII